MIRFVTTCAKEVFEVAGHELYDSLDNMPSGAEMHWYIDGFKADEHPRLRQIGIGKIPRLTEFKKRYANYLPPSDDYNVARYATSVYVAHTALRDYDGIGVYINPFYKIGKPFYEGWIQAALGNHYMAVMKRKGLHTSTAFWVVNCAHAEHKAFMDTWLEWYESGAFKGLANWTDGESLDATIRRFEKAGKITVGSLSGGHEDKINPIAFAPISQFIE